MLSRAGVKGNRKLILVLIQERTLLLVSGRIESSAFSLSLSLVNCSFSLAFYRVLLPSFFLSLLLVLAFLPSLPSFLPSLSCNTFVGQMHSEHNPRSAVTVRICMFVRSRMNLHTCKLPLAGSRSPLIKYARGSHIGYRSPIHHFSRPCYRGADPAGCGLVTAIIFLRPQGAFPPRLLPPFEGGWVNCPAPEAPLTRGMPMGPRAFLELRARVGYGPAPGPT